MGEIINSRYVLHSKLGAGGMGQVYRATDKLTDTVVALKRVTTSGIVLTPDQSSDELQLSLANEFQALASLRHPNIIPVLDYGFDEGLPYFTMQYLPLARTITDVAYQASHSTKINLITQMLQALAYLHRRGIIHRDLKPQNALVNQDGRVTLLDFGLAEENPQAIDDGMISGTLAYIAPEVLQGNAPRECSDLYAVGVMAFEIFAGRHPFELDNPTQLVTDIIHTSPDLADLDIRQEFADIIEKLLLKNPSERYQQATTVLEDMAQIGLVDLTQDDREMWNSYLQAAKFVGREDEITQLQSALSEMLEDKGSTWLIGGESGVGKSRLVTEIQVRAMVRGALPLIGQGVMGGGLPYQLWRDPVRRLALTTEIDNLDAAILNEVAPDLERLLGQSIGDAPKVENDVAQKRLIGAIIALVRTYQKPIVFILEDLHWMGESLEVLKQLNQAVADLPILILATYRSDERPRLMTELSHMNHIQLERLNMSEIADLSASMLGDTGRAPQVVELLSKETEGNVFFLIETVRALSEEAGSLRDIGRMTLPPTVFAGGVQRVVERRLKRIPIVYHPILRLAAIAGRQVDLDLMQALVTEDITLDAWLDVCVNGAVFSVQDGQYRFSHDKLREGLLSGIAKDQLKEMSQRVAEAIEQIYPDDDSMVMILAQHWQTAQNAPKETDYSYRAAEQMLYRDTQLARTYLHRVLTLLSEQTSDPRLPETQYMLGQVYYFMSQYELAHKYYSDGLRVGEEQENQQMIAKCLEGLGNLALRDSDTDGAMTYYERALACARALDDVGLIAQQLNSVGTVYKERGDFKKARELCQQSLEFALQSDEKMVISQTYNTLGILEYRTGNLQGAEAYFEKTLAMRRELGMRHGVAAVLNNLGILLSALGRFETAIDYHNQSHAMKSEIGDRFGVSNSLHNIGITYMNLGDYDKAKSYFEQSLVIAQELNYRLGEADMHNNLGLIIRRLGGDLEEARQHLEQAVKISGEIEDRLGVALALSNLGDVFIELGDLSTAHQILTLALKEAHEINAMQPLLRTIMWFGKLAQVEGQLEEATELWSFVNLAEGCDIETRQDTERLLSNLTDVLPAETLASIIEASKSLKIEDIVVRLRDKPIV